MQYQFDLTNVRVMGGSSSRGLELSGARVFGSPSFRGLEFLGARVFGGSNFWELELSGALLIRGSNYRGLMIEFKTDGWVCVVPFGHKLSLLSLISCHIPPVSIVPYHRYFFLK